MLIQFLHIKRLLVLDPLSFVILIYYLFYHQKLKLESSSIFLLFIDWKFFILSFFSKSVRQNLDKAFFIVPKGFLLLSFLKIILKMPFRITMNLFPFKKENFNFDWDQLLPNFSIQDRKNMSNEELLQMILKQFQNKGYLKNQCINVNVDPSLMMLRYLNKEISNLFLVSDSLSYILKIKLKNTLKFMFPKIKILETYFFSSSSKPTQRTQKQFDLDLMEMQIKIKKLSPEMIILGIADIYRLSEIVTLIEPQVSKSAFLFNSDTMISLLSGQNAKWVFFIYSKIIKFFQHMFFYFPVWIYMITKYYCLSLRYFKNE